MKFTCKNPECNDFDKVEELYSTTHVVRGGKNICLEASCKSCGKERENVTIFVPINEKNIYIGEVAGMNPAQRSEVLKKRSHNHFKKEVEEKKNDLLNRAMNSMKSK